MNYDKIDMFEPAKQDGEESILINGGRQKDELTNESDAVIAREDEKSQVNEELNALENANMKCNNIDTVEIQTSFEPAKLKGEKKVLILGGEEKEELMKSDDVLAHKGEKSHVIEEINAIENANDDVVHEAEAEEVVKNERQVEVISKKKKGKLNKKGKKVLKKKVALKRMNVVIVNDTNEQPLNKGNCQPVEELNNKENDDDDVLHEDDAKQDVKNADKTNEVPKKKKGNTREKEKRGLKKKRALKGVNEVINKGTNGQEASNKKTKKAKIAGMIFMCSSKTKKDCYLYRVLGLPSSKRDIVLKIFEGMKLFLFDFDLKVLYGIYTAAGPGGYNIEPKAFKSAFPSQVRFSVNEECMPLPENKFKMAIKDNYYKKNKFDCQLTSEQVKKLCKLFRAANKHSRSTWLNRDLEAQRPKLLPHDACRARGDGRSATLANRDGGGGWYRGAEHHKFEDHGRTRKPHRGAEHHNFEDQKRSRKRGAEHHKFEDQKRSRKWHRKAENLTFEDRDRSRKPYRYAYEGEDHAPPVVPAQSRPPLPLPLPQRALAFPPESYAYERTLEVNDYRSDRLSEHQDGRFRDLELRHREHIEPRRDSFPEHRNRRLLNSPLRQRRDIEHHDPYAYRDRLSYHDLSHCTARQSECHLHSRTSFHRAALPHNTGPYDRHIGTSSWY